MLPIADQHRLVLANTGLVVHIAKRCGVRMPFEDAVAWGQVGLLEAARRFDPSLGIQFGTYAGHWIRAMLMRAGMAEIGLPNSTGSVRKMFFGLRRAIRACELAGVEPTDAEVGRRLDIPAEAVTALRNRVLSADVHMDAMPEAAGAIHALVEHRSPEDAFSDAEQAQRRRERVAKLLRGLDERERDVVERRLMAEDPETLHGIGESWGVSRERVRQVEAKALKKLRRRMKADKARRTG